MTANRRRCLVPNGDDAIHAVLHFLAAFGAARRVNVHIRARGLCVCRREQLLGDVLGPLAVGVFSIDQGSGMVAPQEALS